MISTIAGCITETLCTTGNVQECDRELYQYGVFMLLSWTLFFIMTCFFGVFLRVPGESILFYVMFSLLRSYAGGVHARTEKACTILTGLTIIACVMVIRLLEEFGRSGIALSLLAVGAVCVFAFCPLDTKEKPLAPDERQRYKKITEAITLLSITVVLFAYYTEHNGILSSVSVSVFVEGVLLIVGKMLKGQNEIPTMTENQV